MAGGSRCPHNRTAFLPIMHILSSTHVCIKHSCLSLEGVEVWIQPCSFGTLAVPRGSSAHWDSASLPQSAISWCPRGTCLCAKPRGAELSLSKPPAILKHQDCHSRHHDVLPQHCSPAVGQQMDVASTSRTGGLPAHTVSSSAGRSDLRGARAASRDGCFPRLFRRVSGWDRDDCFDASFP